MIDTFKKAGVEVAEMSKADFDAWLAIAKESPTRTSPRR